jgi:hypothetical protein
LEETRSIIARLRIRALSKPPAPAPHPNPPRNQRGEGATGYRLPYKDD